MEINPKKLLLVDDDASLRRVLQHHLTEAGYSVLIAKDGTEAFTVYTEHPIDLVITDVRMAGMDGTELLKRIRTINDEAVVIVITAHGTIEAAVTAMKLGAYDYITKPFNREELLLSVSKGLQYKNLMQENRSLKRLVTERFSISNMIGSSPSMQRVYTTVEKVARTNATVLITGESGTGKEMVAKAIHQNSRRHHQPFVIINCGAIPEGLLESELFGHRKGAFTGAVMDVRGSFDTANGGTVFLDEVGELPLQLQVKLLRVLQNGEFNRVGESTPRRVDIRFIAATNRSLEKMIEASEFREDLYFRLKVVQIHLPPLRERRDDIPLLADLFLHELARHYCRPELKVEKEVLHNFCSYNWPGNVRELRNTIESMIVLSDGDTLTMVDLPEHIIKKTSSAGRVTIQLPEGGIDLEKVEREILLQALEKHHWNQTHTARYLNLTRSALIYRMQKYSIEEQSL